MFIESVRHKNGVVALRLLGCLSGVRGKEFQEIQYAFRKKSATFDSGLLADEEEIHLETGPDPETGESFHVNGQGEFLMKHIRNCADGKKIICRDPAVVQFAEIFEPEKVPLK